MNQPILACCNHGPIEIIHVVTYFSTCYKLTIEFDARSDGTTNPCSHKPCLTLRGKIYRSLFYVHTCINPILFVGWQNKISVQEPNLAKPDFSVANATIIVALDKRFLRPPRRCVETPCTPIHPELRLLQLALSHRLSNKFIFKLGSNHSLSTEKHLDVVLFLRRHF